MFDKLLQAQQKADEIKRRLESISVLVEVEGGKIKIIANANKEIKDVLIDADFLGQATSEEIGELLVTAINKALAQADNISKSEMEAVTKDMFGGLGGMFGK